ncbi:MAG: hypothetical protein JWR10_3837 [Rubritepida sp.]|nr:hypothetical protein [Rubritepida sp.]
MKLGGLVGLLMLVQAGAGLFALWYSHAEDAESRARLGTIAASLDAVRTAQASFGVQVQEWKNILLRDRVPALSARHRIGFQTAADQVQTRLGRAALEDGLAAERAPAIRSAHAALLQRYGQALQTADFTTLEGQGAADASIRGADRELQIRLDELADALAEAHRAEAMQAAAAADTRYGQLRLILFVCAGLGLAATFFLLVLALRRP